MRTNDTPICIAMFAEKLWKNCSTNGKCNVCLPVLVLWGRRLSPGLSTGRQVLYWWALVPAHVSAVLTDDSCTWLWKQNLLLWFSMTTKGLMCLKGSVTQNIVIFLIYYLLFTFIFSLELQNTEVLQKAFWVCLLTFSSFAYLECLTLSWVFTG